MPLRVRYEHFDAPKNPSLPVLKDKPDGRDYGIFGPPQIWSDHTKGHPIKHWYECYRCGGWIEGMPFEHNVNTLDPAHLAGRRGTEFYCIRCGEEIHFSGLVS